MNIIKHIFTIFFLLTYSFALSQNNIVVTGKITDRASGEPIAYATVSILNEAIGTLTNEFGEFNFIIPEEFKTDSISFSCIGYNSVVVPVQDYLYQLQPAFITLEPRIYNLDEINILAKKRRTRPIGIIRRAIENIPLNYPDKPFLLHGYFRDYLRDNDRYLNMLEAAVKIEDMGFKEKDIENSNFQILQTRFSPDYVYDSTRMMNFDNKDKYIPDAVLTPFGGNELSVLRVHDPIRNYNRFSFSFVDIMEKDFIENHVFKLDSVTVINDQYVYCIKFSKKNITNVNFKPIYQVNGTIFISADDYAIHKIIYTNYYKQSKIKDYLYNITVEYKKYQDKMYLNYLSFSNYFEMTDLSDSSYFKINSAVYIDQPGYNKHDWVRVSFNHYVDTMSALKKADYLITYNNKKVKIDSVSIDANNIILYIIPPKSGIKPGNWFTVFIKDLKDVLGNTIEVKKKFSMYQYREFFVNNIEKQNYKSISYNYTMPKNSPIYFLKKDDKPDFWKDYNYIGRKKLLK